MDKKYLGEDIKKLGFGFMRLPKSADDPKTEDIEKTKLMVDKFIESGFTYFDTAYVYDDGLSEEAIRDSLVKRYPRESFQLADKLPCWMASSRQELEKLFNTSLERTQAGYFDFYLLHALDGGKLSQLDEVGAWKFGQELKEKGLIKHFGFSFHDKAEVLDKMLAAHPEAEFVQLQINYADWDSEKVESRKCYEVARKYGLPVIIMEPIKGGTLAQLPEESHAEMQALEPGCSDASWALRFAASLDGIITVLSGMSEVPQLEDNVSVMKDFKPLDEKEREVIDHVVERFRNAETIPCTGCRYCVSGCPQSIGIPAIFKAYNYYKTYGGFDANKRRYMTAAEEGNPASQCLECGNCESHCPQHLDIIEKLKECAQIFE